MYGILINKYTAFIDKFNSNYDANLLKEGEYKLELLDDIFYQYYYDGDEIVHKGS
jgi:hypothetical protein